MPSVPRSDKADQRSPRTMAQERRAAIIADRDTQLAEIRRAFESRREDLPRLIDEGVALAGTSDIVGAYLDQIIGPVRATLRRDFANRLHRDPALLEVVQFRAEQGTATTEAYPDGSGLIRVSDAMVSLCHYMAMLVAMGLGRRRVSLRALWTLAARDRDGWAGSPESGVVAALLRYHLQHQRLFGLAAKVGVDLGRSASDFAAGLGAAAFTFLVSHEAAHFVLGHDADGGPVTGERLEALEFEADRFGVEVARRALSRSAPAETDEVADMGANIVMFAIGLVENSLYVRRPRTHPPASRRWERIERPLPGRPPTARHRLLYLLDSGAQRAGDIGSAIASGDWAATWRHPAVNPFHGRDYLRMIEQYDDLQSRSTATLCTALSHFAVDSGVDLAQGLRRGERGSAAVLEAWEMPARTRRKLLDPTQPLTFHSLYNAVKRLPMLQRTSGPLAGDLLALPAACVLERLMCQEQEES